MSRMVLALVVVVVVGLADRSQACVACACGDPTLQTTGTEKPVRGRLRTTLELQTRSERAGALGDGGARIDELRVGLTGSLALTDGLVIGLTVPGIGKLGTAPNLARTVTGGVGDVELRARLVVFTDRAWASRHLLALTAGARVPSPHVLVDPKSGAPYPVDLQPGLGAFGAQGGAFYGFYARPLALFLSSSVYAFTVGAQGFTPGKGVLGSATVQLQPTTTVAVQLGLDGRLAEPNTGADPAGGGALLMASSGVVWSPVTDVTLAVVARVPVLSRQDGVDDGPLVLATASWDTLLPLPGGPGGS